MAIAQAVTCDVCGKQKGEVNHWWLMFGAVQFELTPWHEDMAGNEHAKHLCGQECAIKCLSEWMQK